ncbi:MAG: hypothetical protein WC783_04280 [Candidatus Paceibacterota bacterium]|jgi:hypothetical protein
MEGPTRSERRSLEKYLNKERLEQMTKDGNWYAVFEIRNGKLYKHYLQKNDDEFTFDIYTTRRWNWDNRILKGPFSIMPLRDIEKLRKLAKADPERHCFKVFTKQGDI